MAGSTDWKRNRQYAEYTSTSMNTSGLHSWQFGRFEMRGRIDTRAGMWPAWWTLGNSGEWPSNGEIDIMEFYRGNVLANVACGTSTRYQAKWDSVTKPISSFNDAQWSSKFHVWRMDWDDTKIDLYLDDVLMNTSNLADMLNPNGKSPFRQPALHAPQPGHRRPERRRPGEHDVPRALRGRLRPRLPEDVGARRAPRATSSASS